MCALQTLQTKINTQKEQDDCKKKENKRKEKEVNILLSKEYMSKIVTDSRNNKKYDKETSYSYKFLSKVVDQLPDYMKNKLSEMPSNKGYIWRGVYFYGDLKEDTGPTVMFEKQKNLLIIHENTPTTYKRFEKNGKERKYLVFSQKRKIKKFGTNIMDYIKK